MLTRDKNCLILMKFGSQKRTPVKMTVISPKLKIFEIQGGGRTPFSR